MSRASAGFADFFPTAPSVLQRRRIKTVSDRRAKVSDGGLTEVTGTSTASDAPATGGASLEVTAEGEATQLESGPPGSDWGMSGEVNGALPPVVVNLHPPQMDTLTPLTNAESSPPRNTTSPQAKIAVGSSPDHGPRANPDSVNKSSMTPIHTPPTPQSQTRQETVIKGCRAVYDPDLDKRASREKRRKPEYIDIIVNGQGAPPDPRLAIPNYTRGSGCKQKSKYRPAPYTLRPWPYDAATSIGPGPPIQVVVTGFDPLTPIAPISALFSSFGDISEMNNRTDPVTGRFLGICSIKYKDASSFRGSGPVSASSAARRAYFECKKEQRIGTHRIRVELDRGGAVSDRLAAKMIESQRLAVRAASTTAEVKSDTQAKKNEPPPTAPKGPSGRNTIRPGVVIPEGPRAGVRPAVMQTLVEETPILTQIKRDPYIFIAHCYVPVLSSTIPHLRKRLKLFGYKSIRCDKTGYYIIF